MPTIVFTRTGLTVERPDGARIVDVCDDDIRAGIPFACRHANCGACRVEVLEGLALCEAPNDDESELSAVLRDPPTVRLACQLRVRGGDGTVRLKVLL